MKPQIYIDISRGFENAILFIGRRLSATLRSSFSGLGANLETELD